METSIVGIPPRNTNARVQAGEGGKANSIRQPDHSAGSSNEPACQCHINLSGCMVCRRWSKRIEGIEARRANSLRRQALGKRVRAGG